MEDVDLILTSFNLCLNVKPDQVTDVGEKIFIPVFNETTLTNLCKEFCEISKGTSCVVNLTGPLVVVGDLHGNLHDLIRIFLANGLPPKTSYLFLGDYVDRGSFSLEVITLLFALKLKYPDNICLLRGNHEEKKTNAVYGFKSNIEQVYGNDFLWTLFNSAFEYLPFIAIVNETIFCVHDGISPSFSSISQLSCIHLPIHDITNLLKDLFWSDPTDSVKYFENNQRGSGVSWGICATLQFFKDTGFKTIIRGHQCCEQGINFDHNKSVITVFSASNYGATTNKCGYLCIDENISYNTFPALPMIQRDNSLFYTVCSQKKGELKPLQRNQSITLKNSFITSQSSAKFSIPHIRPGTNLRLVKTTNRIVSKTPIPLLKKQL